MDYKKEIRRALFHIGLGLAIIILSFFLNSAMLKLILVVILVVGLFLSMISRKKTIPVIATFLNIFDRKKSSDFPGRGAFYFVAGSLLALLLFEKNIALASIMVLTFGDSFTNIFGPFGKIKTILHERKKLEGTIIGIAAGTLGAMWFVTPVQAFFGTLLAMIAEMIDFESLQVNDNILVPVIAGIIMTLFLGF